MKWNRRLERRAGSIAFKYLVSRFSKKSPLDAEESGRRLGRLVYGLSKKRREIVDSNLLLAFPEKSDEQRQSIAQRTFEHFGIVMADFARTPGKTKDELLSMDMLGKEYLDDALKTGKGAILITGHFGNWERMSHCLTAHGYTVSVVARDANEGEMNQEMLRIRKSAGVEVVSRGNAIKGVFAALKNNEFVGILPDQNAADAFVPFFGKPCGTVTGPAILAKRAGAPVIPMYCYRSGPGEYKIEVHPPLAPDPTFKNAAEGMMRSINQSLEEMIRRFPEQYLWLHNRWKAARQRGML